MKFFRGSGRAILEFHLSNSNKISVSDSQVQFLNLKIYI